MGWIEELNKDSHNSETEEYGIHLVYRTKKPFDPNKFGIMLKKNSVKYYTKQRTIWLASRPKQALVWGQAGGSLKADSAVFGGAVCLWRECTCRLVENQEHIESGWDMKLVTENEIVFIGQEMDEKQIKLDLDNLLDKR